VVIVCQQYHEGVDVNVFIVFYAGSTMKVAILLLLAVCVMGAMAAPHTGESL